MNSPVLHRSLFVAVLLIPAMGFAQTRCGASFEREPTKTTINVCRDELHGPISHGMKEEILTILGKTYLAQGEQDIAIASWNEASQYTLPAKDQPEANQKWAELQVLIAQTYAQMDKPKLAYAQYMKALKTLKVTSGERSVPSAVVYDSLGTFYAQQKEAEKAEHAFLRSRIVYEIRLGADNPKTIDTRLNNAVALMDLGQADQAKARFEELAKIVNTDTYYENQPIRAEILTFLGTMEMQDNDLRSAAMHYEQAFNVRQTAFGPNDLRTSQSLNNLGVVLFRAGNLQRAEQALSRAYIIRKDLLGEKDPLTVSTQRNLQAVIAAEDAAAKRPINN